MSKEEIKRKIRVVRDLSDETGILPYKKGDILWGIQVEPQYVVGGEVDPSQVYRILGIDYKCLITVGDGWFELAEEE